MSRTKHWMHQRKDRLPRAQWATLPAICEKWRNIVLDTTPSDRAKAEEAAGSLYDYLGRPRPQRFFWKLSPAALTQEMHRSQIPAIHSPARFWLQKDSYLGAVRYYKDQVVKHAESIISDSVPAPRMLVITSETFGYGDVGCHHGPHDARAFAMAEFFATKRHQDYKPLLAMMQFCGGFVVYEKSVIFFERPSALKLDVGGRLHSLDGPALVYRDGTGIFSIHGLRVDRKWIETPADQFDIGDVLKEENAEVRAAMIEKIGFARLLREAKHKVISKRKGNTLIEFAFPMKRLANGRLISSLRLRALHLTWRDKTGPRETILPVPRTLSQFGDDRPGNIDSVEQVRRWTLGWPKEAMAVAET